MTTSPAPRPNATSTSGDRPEAVVPFRGTDAAESTVLLVGNPNVGKSVLFKNLTGRYVTVSNYPGTTVEVVRARTRDGDVEIVDTPGVNDLEGTSEDARVTRRIVLGSPDATLVQVADAKNLRRALLLTLQLAETGRPMALVLNMADELEERGGHVDVEALEARLGIPVVTAVAVRNQGTEAVAAAAARAAVPTVEIPEEIEEEATSYERNRVRLALVREIMASTYSIAPPARPSLRVRLGFWAMDPLKGPVVLLAVLAVVFWFVGLFGAGTLVDLLEVGLFEQRVQPVAIRVADAVLPFPHDHLVADSLVEVAIPVSPVTEVGVATLERAVLSTEYGLTDHLGGAETAARLVHDFFVGRYGMITMAISYALAIVLPIVTTFFLVFSLLEDSGYLPRLSIMLDRVFRLMGLNGKAVLPMILGLGCDTMATMTTRILETRKERIVTTMLLALAVPCSAQLGVLLAMMASLSPLAAVAWLGLLAGVVILVGWLTARLFPGRSSDFLLEIPPLRRPELGNVVLKTRTRLGWYLREVIPLFVVGTAVLFALDAAKLLGAIARLARPVVHGWLGLPAELADAFLVGFLRRDFGAVYLLDAATGPAPALSGLQIFVAMVTITLFMPCFANFLMIAKEHGTKIAWGMAAFIFPFAFLVGGIVHHVGRWLGW